MHKIEHIVSNDSQRCYVDMEKCHVLYYGIGNEE